MAFKLGYSTLRWPTPDLERLLSEIKHAGWEGWELRQSLDWLGSAGRVRQICERVGLPVAVVTGSGISLDGDPVMKERNKRRIDLAAELEADCFMFMGTRRSGPASTAELKALADLADEFADYAAQYSLEVCYHIHNKTTVDSRAEWIRLMELMKRSKLCLDVSHAAFWGYDPVRALQDFQDRLIYVHLQDWKLDRFVELGTGDLLDFPAVMKTLEQINFSRWVVTCPSESERPHTEKIRLDRDYLRRLGY